MTIYETLKRVGLKPGILFRQALGKAVQEHWRAEGRRPAAMVQRPELVGGKIRQFWCCSYPESFCHDAVLEIAIPMLCRFIEKQLGKDFAFLNLLPASRIEAIIADGRAKGKSLEDVRWYLDQQYIRAAQRKFYQPVTRERRRKAASR